MGIHADTKKSIALFEATTAELRQRYPATYTAWFQRTFGPPRLLYEDAPESNCSIHGRADVEAFARFIQPNLRGRVLDIGCGIVDKPAYLGDYNNNLLDGIDPLRAEHPFFFLEGIAEALPWPDATFDVVITATSLDHVLDLNRALAEIARVLRPGGLYLAWEGVVSGSPLYRPGVPHPFEDGSHLFKLGDWWVALCHLRGLTLLGSQGAFYAYERTVDTDPKDRNSAPA